MRIGLITNDTRGGVQPYVALGLGLGAAGHEVVAVAPGDLASMFTDRGIPVTPLAGDLESALRSGPGGGGSGPIGGMLYAARQLSSRIADWTQTTLDACEGLDLMIGGVGGMVTGLGVADRLGIPFVEAQLQPIGAGAGQGPGVLAPAWLSRLGPAGDSLGRRMTELAVWAPFRPAMAQARRTVLGLAGPARAHLGQPVLYAFSTHLGFAPRPAAKREAYVTGYWTDPSPEVLPSPIEAWLAASGPVVSIGFGSMTGRAGAATLADLARRAVAKVGARAIFIAGPEAVTMKPDGDLLPIASIAHTALFPRVQAIVHHGGAGTTGAALWSGVPAQIVPVTVDQPFWGRLSHRLGVAPPPIDRRALTVDGLARGLEAALNDAALRQRAADLGDLIRAEDGVARAVDILGRSTIPMPP